MVWVTQFAANGRAFLNCDYTQRFFGAVYKCSVIRSEIKETKILTIKNYKMSELKRIENVFDITKRLLGSIEPYGDTNIDNDRLENLIQTIELTEKLIDEIILVARFKGDHLFSRKKMGTTADVFISEMRERFGS